jgi:predicted dehydrogenase
VSRQIPLAIEVHDQQASVFETMARRSRSVRLVSDTSHAEALITDRATIAGDAATNQKQVLVLNPFSMAAADRGRFASSRFAVPALPCRFQPSIVAVKQALDAGKLGLAGLLRIHCWQPSASEAIDLLESQLDLAVWLFGDRPTDVYSCQRAGYRQIHLGFKDGGMALIDIDRSLPEGNAYDSLSLIGSTGAAYADDHHNTQLLFGEPGPRALLTSQDNVAIAEMIEAFATGMIVGHSDIRWQQVDTVIDVAAQVRGSSDAGQVISGRQS